MGCFWTWQKMFCVFFEGLRVLCLFLIFFGGVLFLGRFVLFCFLFVVCSSVFRKICFPLKARVFLFIFQCFPLFLPSLFHFPFSLCLSLSLSLLFFFVFWPSLLFVGLLVVCFFCWGGCVSLPLSHAAPQKLRFKGCFHQFFLFFGFLFCFVFQILVIYLYFSLS